MAQIFMIRWRTRKVTQWHKWDETKNFAEKWCSGAKVKNSAERG